MPAILVVDDDADMYCNMADLFRRSGLRDRYRRRGVMALEKARQQLHDLGFLDLRMPGMDCLTCAGLHRDCGLL